MKKISLLFLASIFCFINFLTVSAAARYPDIDEQIFAIQKWLIRDIRSSLQTDLTTWVKQSGSMSFKTKIGTPESSWSINIQVEKYHTLYDAKTKNIEVTYRGMLEFEIHGSDIDYDSYNEDTFEYKKIPFDFYTTVNFDFKIIVLADGSIYMKLSQLDWLSHGNGTMKQWYDLALLGAKQYIGKIYKLPQSMSSPENIDSLMLQKNLLKSLEILEWRSFFVALSKSGEDYALGLNRDTMKMLGWKMSKKSTDIMTYTTSPDGWVIRISDKKNPRYNFFVLTEKNGTRMLDFALRNTWGKNGKFDMKGSFAKQAITLGIRDKTMLFLLDWKNGKLDMNLKNKARNSYDLTPSFDLLIQGDLMYDGSNTNLMISYDGKNIGSLTGKKVWNIGEYALNMNMGFPLFSLLLDLSGKYIDETGDYQILPPTLYEVLGKI